MKRWSENHTLAACAALALVGMVLAVLVSDPRTPGGKLRAALAPVVVQLAGPAP